MSLHNEKPPPDEAEPFDLGGLEKYVIKDRLLGTALEMDEGVDLLALARAEGGLPPGSLGEVWFNEANREVEQFLLQWGDELRGEKEISQILDIDSNGIRLRGELGPFIQGRQILFRCVDKIKVKDRIRTWVRHLFVSAFGKRGVVETRFYSSDKKIFRLQPIESVVAQELIGDLIALYKRGMTEPLPFFPEASYAFHKEFSGLQGEEDEKISEIRSKALQNARNEWYPSYYNSHPEGENSANKLCFRKEPFEDSDFDELAATVFGPMLDLCSEGLGDE